MADPVSKAQIDPNFEKRVRDLQRAAQAEYDGRSGTGQVQWLRPTGLTGGLFDLEGLHVPFNRDAANKDYLEAVKNPDQPGTTGDVVATTTMIDSLAAMERAYRSRHTLRRPRAMALMLGRKRGHGNERGAVTQGFLEYVRSLMRQAKQPQ